MFGKKKITKPRSRPVGDLAQFGIFQVPDDLDNLNENDDEDDEDLEAELAAITSNNNSYKTRQKAPEFDLDATIGESMKDINSDDDESGDDIDPDLLNELKLIAGDDNTEDQAETITPKEGSKETINLLEERLNVYKLAEARAKSDNETGKCRRFARGIKTLNEMIKDVNAGRNINEADIPPLLPPSATNDVVKPKTDDVLPGQIDEETLNQLKTRQQEYKLAALGWKKLENKEEALKNMKIAKQFDIVIAAVSGGEVIDISDMPPPPEAPNKSLETMSPNKEESQVQTSASTNPQSEGIEIGDIESALKERLEVYRRTKVSAESEGNSSKVRRYDRICKQYEEAIKSQARGKLIPLEELPVPPGFPPLVKKEESTNEETEPPSPSVSPPTNQGQKVTTRAAKQMLGLQQRQQELKQAALNAKKIGDIELARDYLRQAKGIQPLIEASKGGLPVDMNSIPLSPLAKIQLDDRSLKIDDDFTVVVPDDCMETGVGNDQQLYENLETQLIKQIKSCLSTRDHSKALGDVPGYNRWERLASEYTRDLDMLRVRKRDSLPPPLHHYETKTHAIVRSCTDLNDSDIEISIIRGINYTRETDTYVMFEFPYPTDNPPNDRTSTIRESKNPEYQGVFSLTGIIDRNSRQCQRSFKRHALKCQIWTKGCSANLFLCCTDPRGFFRSDSLLGTVNIKLQPLETHCTLHDSFPLMDGRKATGGKLEVKIRLRNPILTKEIQQVTDKWLNIDN